MSCYLKAYLKLIGALFLGALAFAAFAALAGCAATPIGLPTHNLVPPPLQPINSHLEALNVIGIVAFSLGIAATVYGFATVDGLIEHIGLGLSLGGCALAIVTLAGITVLPYAPWILLGFGIVAVGAGAYVLYKKFGKKDLPIPKQGV